MSSSQPAATPRSGLWNQEAQGFFEKFGHESLERDCDIPLWGQIYLLLLKYLSQSPPGTILPPELALQKHFNVNRSTVRRALRRLVDIGAVVRARGAGTVLRRPIELTDFPGAGMQEPGESGEAIGPDDADGAALRAQRVYEGELDRIRQGRLEPGQKLESERELARLYGVSRQAVRRAVARLEREGYVHRQPGSMSLVSESASRPMSTPVVGLAIHPTGPVYHPHWSERLRGLLEVLGEAGCTTFPLILPCYGRGGRFAVDSESLQERLRVAPPLAVAVAELPWCEPKYRPLFGRVPLVSIDAPAGTPGMVVCCLDRRELFFRGTLHLLDHGFRKIAVVVWSEFLRPGTPERLAWEAAYRAVGLEPDERFLVNARVRPDEGSLLDGVQRGEEAMEQLWLRADRPDAVFFTDDILAQGALAWLHRQGIRVPEDIGFLAFANMPGEFARYGAISTIGIHAVETGREVGRLVLRVLDGHSATTEQVTLGPRLVARGSCREGPAAPPPPNA